MEKEFVPYELALDLKELGMDLGWYNYLNFYDSSTKEFCFVMKDVPAPLYQQAFRWFREKYDLFCYVELVGDRLFDYMIIGDFVEEEIDYEDGPFNTHEEAELACLQKLIEIVKTK
jgi:hypothetical protein